LAYRNVLATQQGGGGGSGGVTQIVGGTGVTVTPPGGTGVVTIAATASGGVTSIASANANLTVSPVGGTGAVTLTVPTPAVPNPLLNAALGINTTGTGTTTIGNTTGNVVINGSLAGGPFLNTTPYVAVTGAAPSNANWVSIGSNSATSATSATFLAAARDGFIYRISSTGVSTAVSPVQSWSCLSLSYSSNPAYAGVSGGKIWRTDFWPSNNFTEITASPTAIWTSIQNNSNGTIGLVAAAAGVGIYGSSDEVTFTLSNAPVDETYTSIYGAVGNANAYYACTSSGKLYRGTDAFGLTWVLLTGTPAGLSFTSIRGTNTAGGSLFGQFYIASTSGVTYLVTNATTATPTWTLLPVSGQYLSYNRTGVAENYALASASGIVSFLPAGLSPTTLANWTVFDTGSGLLSSIGLYGPNTAGSSILIGRNTGALSYTTGSVTFLLKSQGTVGMSGASINGPTTILGLTNINTTGSNLTTIGNTGSNVLINSSTNNQLANTLSLNTSGTGNTSIGNTSGTAGAVTLLGNTSINATGTKTTTIGNIASGAGTNVSIIGASLVGINNITGGGATTIGNTVAGVVTLVGSATNINTTGTGVTTIGSATSGTLNLISGTGNVLVANSGGGFAVIGQSSSGTVGIYSGDLRMNTVGSGITTIGSTSSGTVALVSPTINVNSTGTGNTNIGNATGGTTTFTGPVVGLPATSAPPYASYQAPTGTTVLSVGTATTIPLSAITVNTGGFFLNTSTNAFRIPQSGYLRITLLFGIQNLASHPGRFAVLLYDASAGSPGTPIANTTQAYLATDTPSPHVEGSTYTYSNTLPYTAGTFISAGIFAQDISLSLTNTINPAATLFVECLT
jgi:hypothetical protein